MTVRDADTVVAILLAEDIGDEQRKERLRVLAAIVAREHPTAEGRTAARLASVKLRGNE